MPDRQDQYTDDAIQSNKKMLILYLSLGGAAYTVNAPHILNNKIMFIWEHALGILIFCKFGELFSFNIKFILLICLPQPNCIPKVVLNSKW